MFTAKEVEAKLECWKEMKESKPEIIRELSESCLGWPYVYAAAGEMCTPSWRRNRMGYSNEKYAAAIKDNCPVLSGTQSSCEGCKWYGCRCFDCRGFTRWLLARVGIALAGGSATTQWETASNWAAKGEIGNIPRGLVCCVFKRKEGKMSHTGMYQGDGEIIHCSTTVKRDKLPGTPAWTHWGIPAGLYTTEELRKARLDVSENMNIQTLRRGSAGDEVEELQALLNAKYGANLEIDGNFGAKTEAAVKAFQQAHGLAADGVVGAKTRAALPLNAEASSSASSRVDDTDEPEAAGSEYEFVTLPRLRLQEMRAALGGCLNIVRDALEEEDPEG